MVLDVVKYSYGRIRLDVKNAMGKKYFRNCAFSFARQCGQGKYPNKTELHSEW